MSDPLLLTFQTQLSGIMETILRSALLEITRLVEGSLLEQVGRGKQEADVLRRRLQIMESKLAERQRVKRVRCADCGRTGLSKKEGDGRDSRTQTGAEVCVTKQETVSEGGRKSCEKLVTTGQEETSASPDTEHKIAEVEGEKIGGTVKEEDTPAAERQVFSTARCHTADHRLSKIHNVSETSGIRTLQPDLMLPPRDKLPVNKSHIGSSQDSVKARTNVKKPDSKSEQQVQPEPAGTLSSEVAPTVSQVVNNPDSVAIKQEVIVVLPSDWDELERARSGITSTLCRLNQAQEELHTVPSETSEDRRVYPGPCVKDGPSPQVLPVTKQPKPARHASMPTSNPSTGSSARGPSFPKSPPLPKPSQSFPQFQRAYADERAVGTLQSGRIPQQTPSIRTHGHVGGHAVRRPYICSHCGKVFSQLCHLKGHQQIHTGERQFCCSLCGRSFTKLSNLKAHRRVHTGERPYICMDCGKRFTQKCNLKRHQRIHSAHL